MPSSTVLGVATACLVVVSHVLAVAVSTGGLGSLPVALMTSVVVVPMAGVRSSPVKLRVQHLGTWKTTWLGMIRLDSFQIDLEEKI